MRALINLITGRLRKLFHIPAGRHRRQMLRVVERMKRIVREVQSTAENECTCAEAYELLDEFAEMIVRGAEVGDRMQLVQQHLDRCLSCREEYEALLRVIGGE